MPTLAAANRRVTITDVPHAGHLVAQEAPTELARIVAACASTRLGKELVYFYASCDRGASYRRLAEHDAVFADRFTNERTRPTIEQRRDFAELTAANELDIAAVSPHMRERYGSGLMQLFTRWQPFLSERAWEHVHSTLG